MVPYGFFKNPCYLSLFSPYLPSKPSFPVKTPLFFPVSLISLVPCNSFLYWFPSLSTFLAFVITSGCCSNTLHPAKSTFSGIFSY